MSDPSRRIDPALAGFAAFSVAILGWFLAGPGGATTSWAVQTCLDVTIVVSAWRLARATAGNRHARRFWRAVAYGTLLCAAGDAYQTSLAVLHLSGHQPSPVQTGFVVLGMLAVVVTMLFHPLGGTGRQRLRLWLDAATVLTAVIVFLWYFVIAGVVTDADHTELAGAVMTSAVMLLITVGLLKLMLSGTAPFARGPGLLASAGVAGTAIAASTVTLLTGSDDPGVIYVSQLVPCLLMPVGMRWQELRMRRAGTGAGATRRRRSSRLPYLGVGAVQLLLVAALLAHGGDLQVWGVAIGAVAITALVLSRQVAAFTDNERLLAELDRAHDQLRHQATHDALTGLANRSLLEQRLDEGAPDEQVSILIIDLDGFKPVNDEHGHHAGDRVLVAVAERLTAASSPAGLAVRLGGDEFAVLLPGTGAAEAQDRAEHIMRAVAEPIRLPDAREVSVGASVGVATGSPRQAAQLLRDADAAMYRTKAARRSEPAPAR
ncbi:diguanylate cyclase domain-containing protein [Actinoplanes sp. URMC 104]|uniref:diguanylate cyclase domain-containing protein n=1 Tax=Actinoplanes sp. URMC 104 TaxID=3423409 RepID=UPI003F1CF469